MPAHRVAARARSLQPIHRPRAVRRPATAQSMRAAVVRPLLLPRTIRPVPGIACLPIFPLPWSTGAVCPNVTGPVMIVRASSIPACGCVCDRDCCRAARRSPKRSVAEASREVLLGDGENKIMEATTTGTVGDFTTCSEAPCVCVLSKRGVKVAVLLLARQKHCCWIDPPAR